MILTDELMFLLLTLSEHPLMNLDDHQGLAEALGVATFCCVHPVPHRPLGPPGCGGTICNTR